MGLFDIFRSKEKKTFVTDLGVFTLVYSKKNKNLWTTNNSELCLTVEGTEQQPNEQQITFLSNFNEEVNKLSDAITKKFKNEFLEADLEVSFKSWQERFKIVEASVMTIFNDEAYWNITFADQKEPYALFTLYIEGQKLTDFSIDT